MATIFRPLLVLASLLLISASALALPPATAYYPFDEGAGGAGTITVDLTGLGNDGTLNGGTIGWTTGHTGAAGDFALNLTGAQNRVNVPGNGFAGNAVANDTISFSFWANQQGNISNSSAFWASSPGASGNERGAQAHAPWGNGTIYFDTAGCCSDPSQRQTVTHPGNPTYDSNWHQYAFVKDGANKTIYFDGAPIDVQGGANALLAFDELLIGAEANNNNNSFEGFIDDFAVFDTALTDQDVRDIFNGAPIVAPAVIPEPASIAIWSLIGLGLAGFGYRRYRRK